MEQDLKNLCTQVLDFVSNNGVLEEMIRSTARDGLERGCEVQLDENRRLRLTNMCTGSECGVRIPYDFKRVASFHTHPYSQPWGTDVGDVLSLGDLFNALHHEELMTCVGQMFENEQGQKEPGVACACLDIMGYKAKLVNEVVKSIG